MLIGAAVETLRAGADHRFDQFVDDLLRLWDIPGAGGTAPAVLGSRLEEAVAWRGRAGGNRPTWSAP